MTTEFLLLKNDVKDMHFLADISLFERLGEANNNCSVFNAVSLLKDTDPRSPVYKKERRKKLIKIAASILMEFASMFGNGGVPDNINDYLSNHRNVVTAAELLGREYDMSPKAVLEQAIDYKQHDQDNQDSGGHRPDNDDLPEEEFPREQRRSGVSLRKGISLEKRREDVPDPDDGYEMSETLSKYSAEKPTHRGIDLTKKQMGSRGNSGIDLVKRPGIDLTKRPGIDLVKRQGIYLVKRPSIDLTKRKGIDLVKRHGIDLTKTPRIDLTKRPRIDLTKKKTYTIDLSKH